MNAAHTLHEIAGEITKCKELADKLLSERATRLATIARLEQENAHLKQMLYGSTQKTKPWA